jgi:hypothetical protein
MRAESSCPGAAGRPDPSHDGIFAAVVFVLVSILLIVTLPTRSPAPPGRVEAAAPRPGLEP